MLKKTKKYFIKKIPENKKSIVITNMYNETFKFNLQKIFPSARLRSVCFGQQSPIPAVTQSKLPVIWGTQTINRQYADNRLTLVFFHTLHSFFGQIYFITDM